MRSQKMRTGGASSSRRDSRNDQRSLGDDGPESSGDDDQESNDVSRFNSALFKQLSQVEERFQRLKKAEKKCAADNSAANMKAYEQARADWRNATELARDLARTRVQISLRRTQRLRQARARKQTKAETTPLSQEPIPAQAMSSQLQSSGFGFSGFFSLWQRLYRAVSSSQSHRISMYTTLPQSTESPARLSSASSDGSSSLTRRRSGRTKSSYGAS